MRLRQAISDIKPDNLFMFSEITVALVTFEKIINIYFKYATRKMFIAFFKAFLK